MSVSVSVSVSPFEIEPVAVIGSDSHGGSGSIDSIKLNRLTAKKMSKSG